MLQEALRQVIQQLQREAGFPSATQSDQGQCFLTRLEQAAQLVELRFPSEERPVSAPFAVRRFGRRNHGRIVGRRAKIRRERHDGRLPEKTTEPLGELSSPGSVDAWQKPSVQRDRRVRQPGSHLVPWQRRPVRIRKHRRDLADVGVEVNDARYPCRANRTAKRERIGDGDTLKQSDG